MINSNDSLLKIAKELVEGSPKPLSIDEIASKVFEIKGIEKDEAKVAQFGIDFMLSGDFVCCGTRNKENVWDLKSRQPASILDKDVIEDLYEDDEDVKNNTLTDDSIYLEDIDKNLEDNNDDDEDDDDDDTDTDDIAEELGLRTEELEDSDDDEIKEVSVIEDDDDEEDEEEEDDLDSDLEDIVVGSIKEKE